MTSCVCLLLAATLAAEAPPSTVGELSQPQSGCHSRSQGPQSGYRPAVGDIVLSVTENRRISLMYRLVLVGIPTHAGIVVRMPGGELGILEAGGGGEFRTRTTPLEARFARSGDRTVWVRQRSAPLTPEQEGKLNEFALLSENTGYSKGRAFDLAWFSLRGLRGPIRTFFDGKPKGVRGDSVCSEIVVEALAYAGIIDAETARPSATAPRDFLLDRSLNLYIHRHPPLACGWLPPAIWIPDACPVCYMKPEPKRGLLRFAR